MYMTNICVVISSSVASVCNVNTVWLSVKFRGTELQSLCTETSRHFLSVIIDVVGQRTIVQVCEVIIYRFLLNVNANTEPCLS